MLCALYNLEGQEAVRQAKSGGNTGQFGSNRGHDNAALSASDGTQGQAGCSSSSSLLVKYVMCGLGMHLFL